MSRALFILKQTIEEVLQTIREEEKVKFREHYTVIGRVRHDKKNYYRRTGTGKQRKEKPIPLSDLDGSLAESIRRLQYENDLYTIDSITRERLEKLLFSINERIKKEYDYIAGKYRGIARPSQMENYSDGLQHVTVRGEMVRSKSEVIIANSLHNNKIDYYYEKPIKNFHPDFTIPVSIQGRTVFWEHCGMMSDSKYAQYWYAKKEDLEKIGIVENKNLIVTFDGPSGFIDSRRIEAIIKEWFKP